MSNLPGYNEAVSGPKASPPISDDTSAPREYNHEKKEQYMPSEGVYVGADGDGPREEETHRALKPRQISMIAIGGAIVGLASLVSGPWLIE
jgi:amino acid transporter